ncbi:hypothetical protein EKO27_g5202 [Xylaria grammica]|uniref:Uncharacterized protein n=1 Tax=Xylaria grammica TaxID=363999 RepID=A0A439D663_9PEZI|nr:hypothetical protein EKO27_g5202 [Xylaria grammica]
MKLPGQNGSSYESNLAMADGTETRHPFQVPIAIAGMACRLPGHCKTPRDLWELMSNSKVADIKPPISRFDLKGHYDGSQKPNTMRTPGAMFMEDVDPAAFDAQFFNINHSEASSMDPQQRLLLEVSYECLENAGMPKEKLEATRLGCIVGASAVDYRDMDSRDPDDQTKSSTLGSCRALLSNRISHFLGVHGPSITIDTACSSALTALQLACLYLRNKEVDAMLVCGVNMYFSPERNQDMGAMRSTASPTGRCYSFDARADGYVIAEAANAVVLKRADDAVRDGDPIRSIIRGVAVNSAGKTAGIAMPNSKAQAAVILEAYNNAGISPLDLFETGYVECHGTGTRAGDPAEAEGLASVFCQPNFHRQAPLAIGSVKGNIGHSEAAAGLSGIIKVVLSLENAVIPGTPTFETPNKNIDFEKIGLKVSRTTIPWPTTKLRASVNSFGFGGANAHAVLESPKYFLGTRTSRHKSSYISNDESYEDFFTDEANDALQGFSAQNQATPHLLLISANDEVSLEAYAASLSSHLLNPAVRISIGDLAYTLSERRSRLHHRAFAVSSNTTITRQSFTFVKRFNETPTLAFVFTGQGAQWPMMGKALLENFSVARETVQSLDTVLRELRELLEQKGPRYSPRFSLFDELIKNQDPFTLRRPELSQPLITALQLAYLSVLSAWGIQPTCVIGHSSGEIAAAVVAGYLSPKDAIKIAFLRGQAVIRANHREPLAMMAVGLGADAVEKYIDCNDELVQIACLNSPTSITVSGTLRALKSLQSRLQKANHFARLLQVDVAYHSDYMQSSGDIYDKMIQDNLVSLTSKPNSHQSVTMFSTVSGKEMTSTPSAKYWKENLTSPVKFDEAIRHMIESTQRPNVFIEIGPSNTLSGPITQIFQNFSDSHHELAYASVAQRNQDAILSLYRIPGLVVGLGGSVDLPAVNQYDSPSVLVDLPNYSWNHSIRHWHESLASEDWRYRAFVKHDLLGSKVLGTTWHYPTWKNKLEIKDLPWLMDHKLGDQIVFPAAGYICMAIEAVHQATFMTTWKKSPPKERTFRMRNAKFSRALVLDASRATVVTLSLAPAPGSDTWHEFRVSSMSSDIWYLHASGMVRIESGVESNTSTDMILPLRNPTSTESWYESMREVGLNFGPSFQKHLAIEYTMGNRENRSTVSLTPPSSTWQQSLYTLHPTCLDGCFQATSSTLWQGDRCKISAAVVPYGIDSLTLPLLSQQPSEAFASARSRYMGVGRRELVRNQHTFSSIYHPETGSLLLEISGLRLTELDSSQHPPSSHVYSRMSWDADIHLLSDVTLKLIVDEVTEGYSAECDERVGAVAHRFISMAAHKNPYLQIGEINLASKKASCLALDSYNQAPSQNESFLAFSQYKYFSSSPSTVASVEGKHGGTKQAEFILFDFAEANLTPELDLDLAVIRLPSYHSPRLTQAVQNIVSHIKKGGLAIIASENLSYDSLYSQFLQARLCPLACSPIIGIGQIPYDSIQSSSTATTLVKIVNLSHCQIELDTQSSKWHFEHLKDPLNLNYRDKVIIVDELETSVMATINQDAWDTLKHLIRKECDILWVTRGSQMQVDHPNGSIIHGLFRTIRNEHPGLNLVTLDVGQSSGDATRCAIDTCLEFLQRDPKSLRKESEFVERAGILYVSRVFPDSKLNKAVVEDTTRGGYEILNFHDPSKLIRLQAEQVGSIDSLHYHELLDETTALDSGHVEIKVVAAGVNFKDVAITLGLIPGNEFLLGGEGSGVITRVASDITDIKPGQRVSFFESGSFGNKITTTAKLVHAIPDSMSFVEAASIPCVFITSMHCLFGLAHVKAGDRVLIHSATGGVGMAAIQLCHSVGATVLATVGSEEKREFLRSRFGIPNERIFSSRTRDFAKQIMCHTQGKGVDVILNSLTGDLLDESWRIIADGGTMIEIGKKDILSRASLSMEPFMRNALLHEIFEQLRLGILQPISPLHQFSFAEIPSALRYIGSGKHIGKLVISDDQSSESKVPVRHAPRSMRLKGDASYLIVGGLRGLCGSLALSLAQNGAKHLTVMSRSSCNDPRSQKAKQDLEGCGCSVNFIQGDVTCVNDVKRTFERSTPPIRGIIQGAMVLRDRTFDSMTLDDYHTALGCKVQGTWNLHNISLEQSSSLDFFTLLSSVSGISGRKGQANYSAGNTFLDAFASYRQSLGLVACSISLGAVEHIGYLAEHGTLRKGFDEKDWHGIGENLLRQILSFSIQQQLPSPINPTSTSHMITGIQVPLPRDSQLLRDPKFGGLSSHDKIIEASNSTDGSEDVRAVFVAIRSKAELKTILNLTIEVCNRYLVQSLRMPSPLDPARPLSVYGVDSLVAVEFRGFVRMELGVELTTLEVLSASSLTSICEQVIRRIQL